MSSIEFTESERQALHYKRFHHPHPRVQRKMETVWLKRAVWQKVEIRVEKKR